MLPFSAQPQSAVAPQGAIGDLLAGLAPVLGTVGGNLGALLPFSAQPMHVQSAVAPQGIAGGLISALAPMLGAAAGELGKVLPFSAQPLSAQSAAVGRAEPYRAPVSWNVPAAAV